MSRKYKEKTIDVLNFTKCKHTRYLITALVERKVHEKNKASLIFLPKGTISPRGKRLIFCSNLYPLHDTEAIKFVELKLNVAHMNFSKSILCIPHAIYKLRNDCLHKYVAKKICQE